MKTGDRLVWWRPNNDDSPDYLFDNLGEILNYSLFFVSMRGNPGVCQQTEGSAAFVGFSVDFSFRLVSGEHCNRTLRRKRSANGTHP